jgi:hypothetical protein
MAAALHTAAGLRGDDTGAAKNSRRTAGLRTPGVSGFAIEAALVRARGRDVAAACYILCALGTYMTAPKITVAAAVPGPGFGFQLPH